MNSWDCFDTLIARRYLNPKTVFDEVGRRLGDPDFKTKRIIAEKSSNKTYADIYARLPGIDPKIELEVELEHNFPIMENLLKVKDGDLILSDMYLPTDFVEKLLRNCGLKKDVKIVVTPDGKKKGWIWDKIEKHKIKNHYGDNFKSDVISAKNNGVNGVHYTGFGFNELESLVSQVDKNLALWMRYTRLICPYTDPRYINFWNDQANLNLPILVLATLELPNNDIAFSYRDCHNWQRIYEAMTGKKGIRLDTSRKMWLEPNEYFKKYIAETVGKNTTIVDLQGKGHSIWNFYNQSPPHTLYIAGKTLPYIERLVEFNTKSLEKHNCFNQGPIVDWNAKGPIRGANDHPADVAEVQTAAINAGIKAASWFKIKRNKDLLLELVKRTNSKNFTHGNVAWAKFNV